MERIGLVTDSTCDLGPATLKQLGVEMVPLKVMFGEESLDDWIDIRPEEFYKRLVASPVLPTTSQPSPAEFLEVYERLADEGYDSIVSIHIAHTLSGTVQSALVAAEQSRIPVHVVDSKNVCHGLSLIVKAAVEANRDAESADALVKRIEPIISSMRVFFVLDTLDYLVKGGRAGKVAGLAAAMLNIKPVLQIGENGSISAVQKVKGHKNAVHELAARVAADAAEHGRMRVACLHGCRADGADELLAEFKALDADVEIESVGLVGSVIGTHAGPDSLGCAYYPIG